MEKPEFHSNALRMFFFWAGIIATFCYRAIVVLNNISARWVQIFWYIGTIGFIIYFYHRFEISEKRAKLIKENKLDLKIKELGGLNPDDKNAMDYIFASLQSSKERWNYYFIFATSFVALVLGIYLDFIRRS